MFRLDIPSLSADDLSVDRHDHSDKYYFPDGMQGASVLPCESNYPPSMDGAYLLLKNISHSVVFTAP